MKICTKCGIEKSFKEFHKRSRATDGYSSCCKNCKNSYDNQQYKTNEKRRLSIKQSNLNRKQEAMLFVRNYLTNHPCVDCGLDDPELLEFDHVRGVKIAGVGRMIQEYQSVAKIKKEIDKCQVRCLHCHRKRTIKTLGWYDFIAGSSPV